MPKQQSQRGNKEAGPRAWFASFASWVKTQDRSALLLIVSVVGAFVVMAMVVSFIVRKPLPLNEQQTVPEVVAPSYRHPLTGVGLAQELTDLPHVFGVMIENAADAWPLSGLDEAFLVIEAPVEAAIPRFIAFFSEEQDTAKIGPVRSARPYYLDWASEFDAVYTHVGGSPEALELIDAYGITDLDEFFQSEYFYRDGSRYAPHNAYTTGAELASSLDELQREAPTYESWLFKDGKASGEQKSLAIDWTSGSTYDLTWNYDAERNVYVRNQSDGAAFLARNAEATANNVVVIESDVEIVDSTGRRHIRTTGEGKAIIAQDGRVIIGTWKKDSRTSRLRFSNDSGSEVQMNAGKTWIEVVPSIGQVTVTDPATTENTGE